MTANPRWSATDKCRRGQFQARVAVQRRGPPHPQKSGEHDLRRHTKHSRWCLEIHRLRRAELYNHDADLGETQNVALLHPERVKAMQATFEKLIRAGRSAGAEPQKN